MAYPPDSQLDARWQQLVTLTADEFWRHNQHPGGGVFEPDRAHLKLRAILRGNSYFTVSLTPEQVLSGDLSHIAREFYKAYRAALASPPASNEADRVTGGAIGGAILGASLGGPPGAIIGALAGMILAGIVIEEQRRGREPGGGKAGGK